VFKESDKDTLGPLVEKILTLFSAGSVAIMNFNVHAESELNEFCAAQMIADEACFKEQTKVGSLASLWDAWDLDNDERISRAEFTQANVLMDLNQDGQTTFLEVQAYFAANNYLICRPLRSETIRRHA